MCALSTAISKVAGPGRTIVPSSARAATRARSTCSWSKVTTLAARREVAELGRHQRRPQDDLGRHLAGGIVGMFGQHGHGQAEGARRLACHPRQLSRSHEPDVMRGQLARSCRRIRIDSGADTYAP